MATAIDELMRRTREWDTGLGTNLPVSPGATGNRGTQRTSVTTPARRGTAQELAAGARQFIGGVAPREQTVSASPQDRVRRALDIASSGTAEQRSRSSAEQSVNPALAENLRLNLIEQRRLASSMQGPGSINPVQFRAMMAQQAQNQAAVNAGIGAIGDIRGAQVQAQSDVLGLTGQLNDRQMAETGAYDRAQLALDQTDLRGQYGLGEAYLQGTMATEGAIAAKQTLDPFAEEALRMHREVQAGFAGPGVDPADRLVAMTQGANYLRSGTDYNFNNPEPLVTVTIPGTTDEVQIPQSEAVRMGLYMVNTNPQTRGAFIPPDMPEDLAGRMARGEITEDEALAEMDARRT